MVGEIFKGCIEQNLEAVSEEEGEMYMNVRGNDAFFKELLNSTKSLIDSALSVIGSSSELFGRKGIIINPLAEFCHGRRLVIDSGVLSTCTLSVLETKWLR
jgi:hypothetical protein